MTTDSYTNIWTFKHSNVPIYYLGTIIGITVKPWNIQLLHVSVQIFKRDLDWKVKDISERQDINHDSPLSTVDCMDLEPPEGIFEYAESINWSDHGCARILSGSAHELAWGPDVPTALAPMLVYLGSHTSMVSMYYLYLILHSRETPRTPPTKAPARNSHGLADRLGILAANSWK